MMWLLITGVLAVFAISFIYSNLGMGGGILFVPLLFWLTDYTEDTVVMMSLFLVLANSTASLMNHRMEKLVDWRLAVILSTGVIFGSVIGAEFNMATDKKVFLSIFLAVVIAVIIKMLIDWKKKSEACEIDNDGKMTRKRIGISAAGTIGGGFMTGCLGLGGGIIHVPIQMYVLGRSTKKAAGTSFAIMSIGAMVGLTTFAAAGSRPDMTYVLVLAPVVFAGSFIGSRWGIKKLNCREVQLLFILVLLVAVVKALWDFWAIV